MNSVLLYEWSGPERNKTDKTTSWYNWFLGVTLVVVLVSLYLANYLFVVFTLIAAAIIYYVTHSEPQIITFGISRKGVHFGEDVYGYDILVHYSINEDETPNELVLRTNKTLNPYIYLPLSHINLDELRAILTPLLPEVPHEEDIVRSFTKKIDL